jgi:16S rRNA (adenine1518-N6/adenine1519-N6)-dimethyltransferase
VRSLGPRDTRDLLTRYGLRPRTNIGQHFVTDPNTVRKMVDIARVAPGDLVVEIGPGLGALTVALLDAGARVVAVERDRALGPVLAEVAPEASVTIADAMKVDLAALAGRSAKLVANLPYNISVPLIIETLERVPAIRSYTVMVQREVGERLAARPGTEQYGAASVKVAYFGVAAVAARVSRRVFYPMPDVESVIVTIDRHARAPYRDRSGIFDVVEAGFAQRRKTIRRALRGAGFGAEAVERALARAGVAGEARAETLALAEFAALAKALGARPSGGGARGSGARGAASRGSRGGGAKPGRRGSGARG